MGLSQVLPLRVIGPGSNGNQEYSRFPKALGLKWHHYMQFSVIARTVVGVASYLSAGVQLAYNIAPDDSKRKF